MEFTHDFKTAVQTFMLSGLPANTPPDARFFLVTGLEGWARGLPELEFQRDGDAWTLRRAYPLGTLLAFNVLMDACEEGDAWGQRRPDRFHLVQKAASHTLRPRRPALPSSHAASQPARPAPCPAAPARGDPALA